MAFPFPYTCYICECVGGEDPKHASPASEEQKDGEILGMDQSDPRLNYALYPIEHLLWCDNCLQIRCPRCVAEETLQWFCPSCLFEVPSSVVKSDGNRCNRNCFNCPVCTSPMTTNSLDTSGENGPPYILACPYCHWSTVEIGIEFEKSTGISSQLAKIENGGKVVPTRKEKDKERDRKKELEVKLQDKDPMSSMGGSPIVYSGQHDGPPSRDDLFSNLGAFYKAQIEGQNPSNPFSSTDINFASPSTYSRIVNFYTTPSSKKNKRSRPEPVREAASVLEGLVIQDPASDTAAIERIKMDGWGATLSPAQRLHQINPDVRFEDELRPVATLLHTRHAKRCRICRYILVKPESKVTSTRFKIKLLAQVHVPRLTMRALALNSASTLSNPANAPIDYNSLKSGIPIHFLLFVNNPIYDPIKVTLAASSATSGKVESRVTILCPQFDVGANVDVWDETLSTTLTPIKSTQTPADAGQIEAGKIWERGRNWTSVVVEVVPGFLKPIVMDAVPADDDELDEDEDVLEIPIFTRIEYETEANADGKGLQASSVGKGEKEKREVAFWVVIGVGRIAPI